MKLRYSQLSHLLFSPAPKPPQGTGRASSWVYWVRLLFILHLDFEALIWFAGSCSRTTGKVSCTVTSLESPQYSTLASGIHLSSCSHYVDTSTLGNNTSSEILAALPSAAPIFIIIAISISALFFFAYVLDSFRHKFGEGLSAKLDSRFVQGLTAWIGLVGFMIGAWRNSYCL